MKATPGSKFFALSILSALVSVFFVASLAVAGEPTDQLRIGINAVLNVLRDSTLQGEGKKEERRQKLRKAIAKQFDFTEMARRSLARYWKKRNADERKEFIGLFSGLLRKSYIGKIEGYSNETIHYVKESADSEFAKVKTLIVTKRKREIPITYRMHKVNSQWRVYDVVIEGVSLVNTYRQQFRTILRKNSYADLVKRLRDKQGEG